MDASVAFAEAMMAPPIISEIDTAGLALLSQVLMDEPTDSPDAIISMPLPEPLPPEKTTSDVSKLVESEEKELLNIVAVEATETLAFEPITGLLPPVGLDDVAVMSLKDRFTTQAPFGVEKMANNSLSTLPTAQSGDIAAYFALEFLDLQYIYYLQRSSVSLGRSSNDSSGTAADIDLGPLKNISRLHARIEYEEELERFVLAVVGRNGAFVDGIWYGPGKRIPLTNGTLIQISTRTFNFLLPHSNSPSASGDANGENDVDYEVPALDSAVTTIDDDSHSTNASATPKQAVVVPEHELDEDDDLGPGEDDSALDQEIQMEFYRSLGGKGKGKGKGKAPTIPPKRGRGRPRKSSTATKIKPAPVSTYTYDDDEDSDLQAPDVDDFDSDVDDEDDRDGDFVPKRTKSTGRRRGGLGKVKSGTTAKSTTRPPDDTIVVKDEEMSDAELDQVDDLDELHERDLGDEAHSPTVDKKPTPKRKREVVDLDFEDVPLGKRRRTTVLSALTEANKAPKQSKGRKKGSNKPEMKSLFTTTPAPLPSSSSANVENGETEQSDKAKGGKKGKAAAAAKKAKKTTGDGADEQDELKEEDAESKEVKEEPKPTGPPPPKPPFTYPLLCYRALKALNGKAPYRAITKWLETEYPYFAAATRDGKDGWENSTRHTLSSHRAFIKIDRKPEERGKGCFWSFDPEFEEQFKDQWRASESQARNPRPGPRPPNPPPPFQGAPGMYPRPPFPVPPPMGWQGVTPPHLMPGYRPMPPGASGAPYPYPPMARPPGMMPHPLGPHPPPMHPMMGPPLGGSIPPGVNAAGAKARAPKKSKAALGAAFSRAPLIRPGLGGVPSKPGEASTGDGAAVDELVLRGEHIIRMAARAAKDELIGRAPPGMGIAVATGGWGVGGFPPPIPVQGAKGAGKLPISSTRPNSSQKVKIVLSDPPPEAPVPMAPPGVMSQPNSDAVDGDDKERSAPRPLVVPLLFFNGTLYINPKAYPRLEDEDVTKMNEMTFADAMAHVMSKCAPIPMPPRPAVPSAKAPEDKDEEDENEASQSPAAGSTADDAE